MNEHLDWHSYFSQLKKKRNCGIEPLGKKDILKIMIENALLFII